MKILLIDDEQSLLDIFTQSLKTIGHFDVVASLTGNEGIQKAKTEKPDIILLDQILPDINGNQVLQMLKQDPTTQTIPVAILSNFNQDGLVQDAINLGAVDYILKYQVEPQDLVNKINQILKEHTTGKPELTVPLMPPPMIDHTDAAPKIMPAPLSGPAGSSGIKIDVNVEKKIVN